MKISTSILSVKDEFIKDSIDRLNTTTTDFIHLDIMDNIFVPNVSWNYDFLKERLVNNTKPLDVHLMVEDVIKYVDDFSKLNPVYITFHYEAVNNVMDTIKYIKSKNIKVGLAIKPGTEVEEIYEYLPYVDLLLVMSVEPGFGGQSFMSETSVRVNKLIVYRKITGLNYVIEVDGGVNDSTINLVPHVDIAVSGSYITNNDYQESINNLKN